MKEVRFDNRPFHLAGDEKKVGDKAPEFNVVDQDMELVSLREFCRKNGGDQCISVGRHSGLFATEQALQRNRC